MHFVALAPFVADRGDGGTITLLDVSESSIAHQDRWIDGTLDKSDAEGAKLNQQLFDMTLAQRFYEPEEVDGQLITADGRARRLANAFIGSFYDLAEDSCDILTEGYGTCSSDGSQNPNKPG